MYSRKKYDIPKKDAQRLHSIKRAAERYGTHLVGRDLAEIARMIREGRSEYMHNLNQTRVSQHAVIYRGVRYVVAYDRKRGTICSFLPQDAE